MSSLAMFISKHEINLFYTINQKLRNTWTDIFMKAVTQFGSTFFCIFISAVFLAVGNKSVRHTGIMLAVNLIVSQAVIQSLKRIVNRPRPYKTHGWVRVIKPPKCRYSFPSGHTCSAFMIAMTLSMFFPWLRPVLIGVASLVGISRIYLGCHYPTDVILGFVISFLVFTLTSCTILQF